MATKPPNRHKPGKSLKIDPDLHKRLKIRAAMAGVDIREEADVVVAAGLAVAGKRKAKP